MTNTKQELIAIRDGAPSGEWPVADEVGILDGEIVYISNSENGRPFKVYCDCDGHHLWCYGEDNADFLRIRNRRKLSDIRAQIKLMEENEKLVSEVKELRHQLGMSTITAETKARLLESCEIALAERDEENEKLVARVAELETKLNYFDDVICELLIGAESYSEKVKAIYERSVGVRRIEEKESES